MYSVFHVACCAVGGLQWSCNTNPYNRSPSPSPSSFIKFMSQAVSLASVDCPLISSRRQTILYKVSDMLNSLFPLKSWIDLGESAILVLYFHENLQVGRSLLYSTMAHQSLSYISPAIFSPPAIVWPTSSPFRWSLFSVVAPFTLPLIEEVSSSASGVASGVGVASTSPQFSLYLPSTQECHIWPNVEPIVPWHIQRSRLH